MRNTCYPLMLWKASCIRTLHESSTPSCAVKPWKVLCVMAQIALTAQSTVLYNQETKHIRNSSSMCISTMKTNSKESRIHTKWGI